MHPVTFLTHFRIPSLPLLFLLLPDWPRGRQCSEPPAGTPWTTAGGCIGCLALRGTLRKPAPPPPATLACTSSGSHELVSTCWQLQPQAQTLCFPPPTPLRAPLRAKPLVGGNGNADSSLQTRFPPSAGLRGPRVEGTLPPTPSPPGGTQRWGAPAARPQPDCAGNLGFLWARGGDAAESRPGLQGRGQVAGGDQWVCGSGRRSPGRGREAAVAAATSERAPQLSNFACAARPSPASPGPARGCALPG